MGCGLCTKNFLKLSLLATPTVVHRKAASICNSSHGSILQMQNLRPTQNFWIKTCILIRFPTWISLRTFSSVQFTRSVMSKSLLPHGLQHTRPPCPSPNPIAYSDSCPSSQWCHPNIPSSVIPFSSCPQSFPASGSFPLSQLCAWSGQSIGVSASASVLPMNTQDWSPWGWTGWLSLQSKGCSKVFSNTTVQKHQFFSTQLSL